MKAKIGQITLKCADRQKSASFWSLILNGAPVGTDGESPWITAEGPLRMAFEDVADGEAITRLGLDVDVDYLELAVVRAVRLGASPVGPIDRGGPDAFQLMRDPEGFPFRFVSRSAGD
ncbi:VOC family protein [Streptomyces sp. cg36]|uniref:VOC family protein n=1 Tax=Streptomyces sp. cg36 TaxID=3238798 RepID=UPI0034E21868